MATLTAIREYLQAVPAASVSWAEVLHSAGHSMAVVQQLVETMASDVKSPLRMAEEGLLNEEIMRLVRDRGSPDAEMIAGLALVKIRAALSAPEQTRVLKLVSRFCQVKFETSKKYGRTGHAVMNATRRVTTSYTYSRISKGLSVVEVGPDVAYWILSPTPKQWEDNPKMYKAAAPVLGARDSGRASWKKLASAIDEAGKEVWQEAVVDRARLALHDFESVFKKKKIQDSGLRGEVIVSNDSNYDIKFDDMPRAMIVCGARLWLGVMVRAKGLTRVTRMEEGVLDLMGVHYRVNWKVGRIDFRHPECMAFGYSHNVWEYMKYEERNGYVWETGNSWYIYAKGPETNEELLFFSVCRVLKGPSLYEPVYVAHPLAGRLEIESIWAVGDEISGVPRAFERVKYQVEELAFSKVWEKRRALDHKGDLATTMAFVRSTGVRFWMNGVPVGVKKKIEQALVEATAVAVETMVVDQRLADNWLFGTAMQAFSCSVRGVTGLQRILLALIDLRELSGRVSGFFSRAWESVREPFVRAAIAGIEEIKVEVRRLPAHMLVDQPQEEPACTSGMQLVVPGSECICAELFEIAAAMKGADGDEYEVLEKYRKELGGYCHYCATLAVEAVETSGRELEETSDSTTVGENESSEQETVTPVVDKDYEVKSWRDEEFSDRLEVRAMKEAADLGRYLPKVIFSEVRVDARRIIEGAHLSEKELADCSTTRTRHYMLKFYGGKNISSRGPGYNPKEPVSAIYCMERDVIVPTRRKGFDLLADVKDGWYYSCNHLRVWNHVAIVDAVETALDYGHTGYRRDQIYVVRGVPGAGKTFNMMERALNYYKRGTWPVLILAVTNASVDAAMKYGVAFGIPENELVNHVMTLDRYLIHVKKKYATVFVDEFPMEHVGKVDAAMIISSAVEFRWCGDGEQIEYDPFCEEFGMKYGHLNDDEISAGRLKWLCESHRSGEDVCAMWLDRYPAYYPCKCHSNVEGRSTVSVVKISTVDDVPVEKNTRYMSFTQAEKAPIHERVGFGVSVEACRKLSKGGLATVHEDQGSTHSTVSLVRLNSVYDKNGTKRNPSLYNRIPYCLTATTRHVDRFVYYTVSDEVDEVIRRIALAKDPERLQLVRSRQGFGAPKRS